MRALVSGCFFFVGLAGCAGRSTERSHEATAGAGGAGAGGTTGSAGVSNGGASNGGASAAAGSPATFPCASATITGVRKDVRVYFVVDRALPDAQWALAHAALANLFEDESSAGLDAALGFFPRDDDAQGCSLAQCDPGACAEPDVGLGRLLADRGAGDPQETALLATLSATSSAPGDTMTATALEGALAWASVSQQEHPDATTLVVLLSGSAEDSCGGDFAELSALAERGAAAGVFTDVIGFPGDEARLDAVARAAGTSPARILTEPTSLVGGFTPIQSGALSCDFPLPAASEGQPIDWSTLTLVLTKDGESTVFVAVSDVEGCGDLPGWYFDDPGLPQLITLCPAACTELQEWEESVSLQIVAHCVGP